MEWTFKNRLQGEFSLAKGNSTSSVLKKHPALYKIIWVEQGSAQLFIDHIPVNLTQNEVICLSPYQIVELEQLDDHCTILLFNSNFYCIFGHDDEVSCNGFLFKGSDGTLLKITSSQADELKRIREELIGEYDKNDSFQEEMLRMQLKRFIIACTRIAKESYSIRAEDEESFNLIRQFHVLVDNHFREKKKVGEYAALLHRSPKTLSNIFTQCKAPSPLRIIHERILAEAKRLLLYTDKPAKEIAYLLGFEDPSAFSRFFKKQDGNSISTYRKEIVV